MTSVSDRGGASSVPRRTWACPLWLP
jgi:hypothetical protein